MRTNLHPKFAISIAVALSLVISTAQGEDVVTFASWMATFDFTAFPGADLSPTGDADGDGIANAVEFVIGNLPNQTKVENLPTLTRVTNPNVGGTVLVGNYLKFSYRRSDASDDAADISLDVAYSRTDLAGPWSIAGVGEDGVELDDTPNPEIPGVDVAVYIPLRSDTKFFARLQVTVP